MPVTAGAKRANLRKFVLSPICPIIGCKMETPWYTSTNNPASALDNERRSIKKGSSGAMNDEYVSCIACAEETTIVFKVCDDGFFNNLFKTLLDVVVCAARDLVNELPR